MEVYNHLECEYIYRTAVKETGEGLNIDPDTSSRTCGQVLEALTEAVGEAIPLAPEDLRPDLQRVFDTYYRVIYGNGSEPPVSEQENALAGKVREKLSHSASASHSPTDRKTSASGAT